MMEHKQNGSLDQLGCSSVVIFLGFFFTVQGLPMNLLLPTSLFEMDERVAF